MSEIHIINVNQYITLGGFLIFLLQIPEEIIFMFLTV